MRVSGQIEEVSLEQLENDPVNLPEGRIWENTTTKDVKTVINNIVRKIFTSADQIPSSNIADNAVTTSKISDNQVTTSKLVDSSITSVKIANASVTRAKQAALGQQISAAVPSNWATTSGTFVDVPNLFVSITTSGRPVWVGLVWDTSSANSGIIQASNTTTSAISVFSIVRGSAEVSRQDLGMQNVGGTSALQRLPCGVLWTVDTPVAGTYTYKIQSKVVFGTATVDSCKLIAFEL